MNCDQTRNLMSAFQDDELDSSLSAKVQAHLNSCPECREALDGFVRLADLSSCLAEPIRAQPDWASLKSELDREQDVNHLVPEDVGRKKRAWAFIGMAALALIAVAIGLSAVMNRTGHSEHAEFTAVFGDYLELLEENPAQAQAFLLSKYDGLRVEPERVQEQVGYVPVVSRGLPEGYTSSDTFVMTMPCCTCVQTICQRSDGTSLVLFEHDDDEMDEWFGDREDRTTACRGKNCSIVSLDDQLAATWTIGPRHITLVGANGMQEVEYFVEQFE